jgi:pimeloyl-ACP methyl ester carboxylesterase
VLDPSSKVRVIGSGSERVLISHGWIGDSHMFDPMLEFIDRRRFTVGLLDHRGYGARSEERTGLDIETSAADLLAVADALGWTTFGIIGHSMGGLAAQRLAADAPQRLTGTVLVAPVPAGEATLSQDVLQDRLAAIGDLARRRATIDTNAHDATTAEVIYALNVASTHDEVLASFLRSWSSADFAAEVTGCPVPTLVVYGGHDPAIPEALLRRTVVQWFTDVRVTGMPTGHYPMVQAPQLFWAHCAAHLRAITEATRSDG